MNGHLSPLLALFILLAYFAMLVGVAWRTGRDTGNEGFFLANRQVKWYVVAFAMIGTSISGVTFISIPGKVGAGGLNQAFSYMQMVLGYSVGYLFVGAVLLPLYYRLQLTSIYTYLEQRLGPKSYKTGAAFFLVARTFGSAARMFLAALVLQNFIFGPLGVPFFATAILMLALIYVYTYKGGMKTIIWTDTIMTACLLLALVWTVFTLAGRLNLGIFDIAPAVARSTYSKMFFWENFGSDPNHFIKQFVAGALTVVAMTGLDQDLMQKNLACKNIKEAQKNMAAFYAVLVFINLLFLTLGALLYLYAAQVGLQQPAQSDALYPTIAFQHLDMVAGIVFLIGIVASTYASSDSALTALTTSFCIDFLGFEKNSEHPDEYASEKQKLEFAQKRAEKTEKTAHIDPSWLCGHLCCRHFIAQMAERRRGHQHHFQDRRLYLWAAFGAVYVRAFHKIGGARPFCANCLPRSPGFDLVRRALRETMVPNRPRLFEPFGQWRIDVFWALGAFVPVGKKAVSSCFTRIFMDFCRRFHRFFSVKSAFKISENLREIKSRESFFTMKIRSILAAGLFFPKIFFGQNLLDSASIPQVEIRAERLIFAHNGLKINELDSTAQVFFTNLTDVFADGRLGIWAAQNGPGSLSTLSARGSGGNRTAVVWNGLPLQSTMNGVADGSLLSYFENDKISVQTGGASSLAGSGSVGGTINLSTIFPQKTGWSGNFGHQESPNLRGWSQDGSLFFRKKNGSGAAFRGAI